MSKLLMLRGLPASGKSTYAKELVAQGWKRVNKDDLRAMIDFGKWSNKNEMYIKYAEIDIATRYLKDGFNVVVDDTNFVYEEMWSRIAKENKADFEIKTFDTLPSVCIERDAKRGDKSVGTKVIMGMYDRYLKPKKLEYNPELKDCFIFDIDGTLAHMTTRGAFDWERVREDEADKDIKRLFQILKFKSPDCNMIIFSGRDSVCREDTEKWLTDNNIFYDELYMRTEKDSRKDSIIKKELYDAHIKDKYNVIAVFDDRDQCIELWRGLGLTALQVDYGAF